MSIPLSWPFQAMLTTLLTFCYGAKVQASLAPIQSSVYYVIPFSDIRPPLCVPSVACHTLDQYITDGTLNSSHSKFVFLNGTHRLTKSLMVYDSESLTLQGSEKGNNSVQVVCESRWTIAMSFTQVSFLTIQNISFVNCSYNNSFFGPKKAEYIVSALHFEGGSTLTLSDVRILNGGFSIINTHGQVEITRVNITSLLYVTESAHSKHWYQSFGGSYIYHKYSTCKFQMDLIIQESTFNFQRAVLLNHSMPKNDYYNIHGLGLLFNCTNIHVLITKSNFSGFESGGDGGNLIMTLQKSQYVPANSSYMITISECRFVKGRAIYGGGVLISLVQPYLQSQPNVPAQARVAVLISRTEFLSNTALGGGALSFYLKEFSALDLKQKESGHPVVGYIQIEWCTFKGNYLTTTEQRSGIAIYMITFHVKSFTYHPTLSFNTTLQNCLVQDNHPLNDTTCSFGNGVITLVTTVYFRMLDSKIIQNKCTAIKAIASNLLLEGKVNITNNHGSSGGGLLLSDNSAIVLKPNTQVIIVNNSATYTGGGISVNGLYLQTRPKCFFQLSEEITNNSSLLNTVKIVLINNTAGYAGNNLFGGSVDYCYLNYPQIYYKNTTLLGIDTFEKMFANLTFHDSSVSSNARRVCFCNGGAMDCSIESISVSISPGETFHTTVVPVGQLNGTVPAYIHAATKTSDGKLTISQTVQHIEKSECQKLKYTVNTNRTIEMIVLTINYEGDISAYTELSLFKAVRINVTIKPCPVAFEL